jgi:peroxiredoxin
VVAVDETGELAYSNADLVTGRPLLLLFCPSGGEAPGALLAAFRDRAAAFASLEAGIHAVSRLPVDANQAAHAALRLPFKLLTDATGDIFRTYGAEGAPLAVILDPNHRVARMLRGSAPAALADAVLAYLRQAFPPRGLRVQAQAPILLLPRVLGEVIAPVWSSCTTGRSMSGPPTASAARATPGQGDFKVDMSASMAS